ncbi:MAG TPA: hypothetical protein DIT05_19475 [Morganella sp. (in: Bacteria)]|nr:hypothetical protein [Morganella sp. (in: enterobacteria)]
MDKSDLIKECDVFEMTGRKRTAIWHLRKKKGFPNPIFSHPAKYSRSEIERWMREGGVSREIVS